MALTATMYTFDVELADVDRGVYTTLAIRAARHPLETEEYLLTRVLAYCLEHAEGIEFSRGLAEPDDPALTVRDLTGAVKVWIEIGAPNAERLHRATRAAPRVVVYTHKEPAQLVRQLEDHGSTAPSRSSCTRSTASSWRGSHPIRAPSGVQPVSDGAAT